MNILEKAMGMVIENVHPYCKDCNAKHPKGKHNLKEAKLIIQRHGAVVTEGDEMDNVKALWKSALERKHLAGNKGTRTILGGKRNKAAISPTNTLTEASPVMQGANRNINTSQE